MTTKVLKLGLASFFGLLIFLWFGPERGLLSSNLKAFAYPLTLLASCLSLILLCTAKWRLMALGILSSIGGWTTIEPYLGAEEFGRAQKAELTVLHCNVLTTNPKKELVSKQIVDADADLVSLVEVDDAWQEYLGSSIGKEYPYSVFVPWKGNYGMALYSKLPILDWELKMLTDIPSLLTEIQTPSGPIHCALVHTSAPVTKSSLSARDTQLDQIGDWAAGVEDDILLVGDLNAVPWSKSVKALKEKASLSNSRKGLAGTWPSALPFFQVPIDHILSSSGLHCVAFEKVNLPGSDHDGILAGFDYGGSLVMR